MSTFSELPRDVRVVIAALFATSFASRAQLVALGLLVFDLTGRELDLGLLGLAEFVPLFVLAPFSGYAADRFDRRLVYGAALLVELVVTAAMFVVSRAENPSLPLIFFLVVLFGSARAFVAPASRALPIDLAPLPMVERVVALRSVAFQSAGIVGPFLAGLLFTVGRSWPFLLSLGGFAVGLVLVSLMRPTQTRRMELAATGPGQMIAQAVDGLRFIRRRPVLFGAITLDLFGVLFGGAVALLPAIGEKRLGVDEAAVGFMYSAIAVGALITASMLSVRPIRRRVGPILLLTVLLFGTATIVLGLTRSYVVAVIALVVLSAADAISVFIRATLVPLASPEEMRGRVLAVENVFIGGSNELGALESGLTAAWFGLAPAVIVGGVATVLVAGTWGLLFPELRRIDRFSDVVVTGGDGSDDHASVAEEPSRGDPPL